MRVLLVTFVKYTLSQHNSYCNRNYFLVLFGDWKLLFCNKKLFKSLSYLCICFAQKIAGLILKRLWLLGNGWSFRVVRKELGKESKNAIDTRNKKPTKITISDISFLDIEIETSIKSTFYYSTET